MSIPIRGRAPPHAAAWPAEARRAPDRFPDWTKPDENDQPRFVEAGDSGPRRQKLEVRRHVYRQGGTPVRIKIVRDGKAPLNVYRVVSEAGKAGWQPMRPAGFRAVPYFHQDANPFDGEGKIYWTGDEETADVLAQAGFQAFTFGVARVGLPAGCEAFVSGRDVVVVASTDKAGREHAKVKADLAQQVAKSVRVVTAFEVLQGDEVTCIPTATSEPEPGRLHNVNLVPAMPEVDIHLQPTPGRAGSSLEHSLAQPNRARVMLDAYPVWPNVLVPYDERDAISVTVAARKAGKAVRTIRLWACKHGIGRRIAGGNWTISRVALQMLLDGDQAALDLYHDGDRKHPRVAAYFERLRREEFA